MRRAPAVGAGLPVLVVVAAGLAPHLLGIIVGAGLMAVGLLCLAWGAGLRGRGDRLDLLALLLAIVALVGRRKRP